MLTIRAMSNGRGYAANHLVRRDYYAEGQRLRPRQSADRLSEDGEIQSRGRHPYDFALTAPKSVSILGTLEE